jgi:hypothetical protein
LKKILSIFVGGKRSVLPISTKKWDLMERVPLSTITNKKTVAFSKIYILPLMQEKFEDAKGVIRKCKP